MKYYYQKPELIVPVFGQPVTLEHPVYKSGTLYLENSRGVIVTQKHFNPDTRECWWGAVDVWLANDLYTSKNFPEWFFLHATEKDYPITEVRKLMWAIRMKPLKKEEWEFYF